MQAAECQATTNLALEVRGSLRAVSFVKAFQTVLYDTQPSVDDDEKALRVTEGL